MNTPPHDGRTLRARHGAFLRWLSAMMMVFLFVLGGAQAEAQEARTLEYQVKAAFLVKFASFVQWPDATAAGTNGAFTIGILGDSPFGNDFNEAIKNERVGERPMRLKQSRNIEDLADCQIIYIAVSESKRLEALLKQVEGKPVLIVGDDPGIASRGAMIGFIKEGGRVRFETNTRAAERARLKLSAKLLQVSKVVVSSWAKGDR